MPTKDKQKIAEKNKRYREKNREKINALARERYHQNKPEPKPKKPPQTIEERRAYQKEYYAKNRERILNSIKKWQKENKEYLKKYVEENKERLKQNRKEWDKKNRERINKQSAAWAKKNFEKNPEKVRELRRLKKKKQKAKDPEKFNANYRRWNKKAQRAMVDELQDCYVRRLLCKHGVILDLSAKDIPQELIEAKRLEIQIRRLLNEKRN